MVRSTDAAASFKMTVPNDLASSEIFDVVSGKQRIAAIVPAEFLEIETDKVVAGNQQNIIIDIVLIDPAAIAPSAPSFVIVMTGIFQWDVDILAIQRLSPIAHIIPNRPLVLTVMFISAGTFRPKCQEAVCRQAAEAALPVFR